MIWDQFIEETRSEILEALKEQCHILGQDKLMEDYTDLLYEYCSRGKLLRACFVVLTAKSFNGDSTLAVRIGALLELGQATLLIHDDVMDGDSIRRGKPSMHKQFTDLYPINEKTGESLAICLGDAVLFHLFQELASYPDLVKLFGKELCTTALGQAYEIKQSALDKELTQQEIFTIMEHKTAHYTFILPFLAGLALTSKNTLDYQKQFTNLGLLMGYLFQIKDDELNLLGDQKEKGIGGDIRENKKTLCRSFIIEEYPETVSLFGTEEHIQKIISLYQHGNAIQKIEELMNKFYTESIEIIEYLKFPKEVADLWTEFVHYLLIRKK